MPPTVEVDIKDLFDKIDRKLDTISKDVADLKVGQARLEEKVESLGKRLDNQEFISRSILAGLIVAFFVGLSKMFGFLSSP